MTDPDGNTETDDLDPAAGSRLVAHTDALGNTTRYAYDNRGFREATTDPDGHTTTLAHDALGDVTTKVTCRSRNSCQKSTATYDTSTSATDYAAGKILTASDPRTYANVVADNTHPGYVTTWTYNAQGLVSTVTEPATGAAPKGRVTTYTYTTSSTPAADGGTQIGNQLASVTDANGAKTSYTYFSGGQVATITSPMGAVTRYEYTADSYGPSARVVTDSSYPAGIRTTYTYDAENRPLTVTEPETVDAVTKAHHRLRRTYGYDDDGNVDSVSLADVAGTDDARTSTYTYTAGGRLASSTDAEGNKTTQQFNAMGERSATVLPDGDKLGYGYSATGELQTTTLANYVGDPNAPSAPTDLVLESRAYDPAGRLASVTDAMGRVTAYHYLDDGLLADRVQASGTPAASQERWEYDAAGNASRHYAGCDPAGVDPCLRSSSIFSDAANRPIETDDFVALYKVRTRAVSHDPVGNITATTTEDADTSTSPAKITDPHQTTLAYDAGNNLTSAVNKNGSSSLTTTYTRDTAGRLLSKTSPAGRKVSYGYDQVGQVESVAKPKIADGQSGADVVPTWSTGYDTFGETEASRDADGNVVTYAHDGDGDVTTVAASPYTAPGASDAVTPTVSYTYDAMSRPVSQSDAMNYRQVAGYDQLGNVASVTLPGGAKQTFTYDPEGEQLTSTSPTGARTEQTYDELGHRVTATDDERYPTPSADTTTYVIDRLGNDLSMTDPLGNKTAYGYDRLQNRVSETSPTGKTTTTAYDSADRAVSVTAPDGTSSVVQLDEAGRQIGTQQLSTTGTVLSSTSATYDGDGNRSTETDESGHVVTSTYDGDGNLTRQTQPDGNGGTNTTSFGYDAQGNRTSYTDPNGYTTSYTYNSLGRQESSVLPAVAGDTALADRATTVAYDADGRPVTTTRPGGVSVTRHYNAAGEVAGVTGSGAAAEQRDYTYDDDGRLTKATSGSTTVTATYEDRGQVLTSSDAGGQASMTYDAADNLRARTDAAGSATFSYDAAGNLTKQAGPAAGSTTDWSYTANGQVAKTTYEGVASIAYGYDGQHRTTSETVADPAGKNLTSYTYGRNAAGQVTSSATSCSTGCTAGSTTYTYDALGRLATSKSGTTTTTFGYDGDGNLTKGDGYTAAYNEQDELTSSTNAAGTTRYGYSLRGTLDSVTAPNGDSTSSSFDAYDELVATGGRTYSYDALGRTSSISGQGADNTFSYDGVGTEPVSDGSQTFGRTPSGAPITSTSGSATTDLVTDDHGDVLEQLSKAGVGGSNNYAAYGAAKHTGTARTALGFEGGWTDSDGNVMTASRWYSPVLNRFLSADSQQNPPTPAVNANRYAYGNDDPLDRTDRSGHSACRDYEREAVEQAEERKEEERAERQIRDLHREIAREHAEQAREDAEVEREDARDERAAEREERAWDEEEFEEEHGGESRSQYERELEDEARHPERVESRPWWEDVLEDGGEFLEDGAEFVVEDPEVLLLLESFTNPSLGDCGSGAEPERVTPRNTEQRARQGVQRAVDHPDSAPAEDPAAKAASEPKTFHPAESGDETTSDTAAEGDRAAEEVEADPGEDDSAATADLGDSSSVPRTSYSRPNGATTAAQRQSVQGQPCVSFGTVSDGQVADHTYPLVQEYYETGTINLDRMRVPLSRSDRSARCVLRGRAPRTVIIRSSCMRYLVLNHE
ncbi:RHS repeat-associated core domain-containing protein [Jatrophihabitans endophyticus]|uniref:RHS repeat-associated core domain-containing protein n=1 Tax=Jatrophihabitans endophyticus TaxID=1206085 RepID=A0A1M5EG17_9ACTN|nr:RHS repeat-associated core domain-containing protein [Jatrophihabitans endophyticus]SHF78011.1 RHS repeat-associated core domain-containing protein [Jatrophihabitans endophyticus]